MARVSVLGVAALLYIEGLSGGVAAQPASQTQIPLTKAVQGAVTICMMQTLNKEALKIASTPGMAKVPVTAVEKLPERVQRMTERLAGVNPFFARLSADDGSIWLVGSTDRPICQAVVTDTTKIQSVWESLNAEFSSSPDWVADAGATSKAGPMWTQAWEMKLPNANNARLKLHLSGPAQTVNGGDGPQAGIQLALLPPR